MRFPGVFRLPTLAVGGPASRETKKPSPGGEGFVGGGAAGPAGDPQFRDLSTSLLRAIQGIMARRRPPTSSI